MYFLDKNFDLYSASVTEVTYAISCYVGPRYNGTRLYCIYGTLFWGYSLTGLNGPMCKIVDSQYTDEYMSKFKC